jgi:hypothetical protein
MTTIFVGKSARVLVTVQDNGVAVPIATGTDVKAELFTLAGESLSAEKTCQSSDAGANWPVGVVAVAFTDLETGTLDVGTYMLVLTAPGIPFSVKRFKITVQEVDVATASLLFVKDFIVEEMRADKLLSSAQSLLGGAAITDDYIWGKILAAESQIAHDLRVPLVPTKFFPSTPTADQIAALDGMPWQEDPGYDYHRDIFFPDAWGMLRFRNKPVISVESMKFEFPVQGNTIFDVPLDWLRLDKKYGQLQFVPSAPVLFNSPGAYIMSAMSAYATVPMMIKAIYVAGLEDAHNNWPELIDIIKKMAVLKAIEDRFPAQSGSISADGLSQSLSVDMAKYHETIDTTLNGPKGSNGGLMAAIHGIRSAVLG